MSRPMLYNETYSYSICIRKMAAVLFNLFPTSQTYEKFATYNLLHINYLKHPFPNIYRNDILNFFFFLKTTKSSLPSLRIFLIQHHEL